MCGIAGSLRIGGEDEVQAVNTMTQALIHRGPDCGAVVKRGRAVMGHRRLAIIDTSKSASQPMDDKASGLCIVFNGEIYNFQEIRAELEGFGDTFHTKSDTEVLLKSYARWGSACLQRFNGMFAFAIWNPLDQTLFLARDRLGKKPLYYQNTKDGLIFASELPALLRHPAAGRTGPRDGPRRWHAVPRRCPAGPRPDAPRPAPDAVPHGQEPGASREPGSVRCSAGSEPGGLRWRRRAQANPA